MHEARWHSGKFFMIQDERATIAGKPFDTFSLMGVDDNGPFARTFDNNGFYRHYPLTVDGDCWTVDGETERATIEFSEANRRQTIHWEWKPDNQWLPLCDRVAVRED